MRRNLSPPADDDAFAFRLLSAVQRMTPNANTIISPASTAIDLSMVLNGATGQARQELLDALSLSGADLNAAYAARTAELYFPTPMRRAGSMAGQSNKPAAGFPMSSTGSTRPRSYCF